MKMKNKVVLGICGVMALVGSFSIGHAQIVWDNATVTSSGSPGDWLATDSWVGDVVPGAAATAQFNSTTEQWVFISAPVSVGSISRVQNGTTNLSGSALTLGSGATISHSGRNSLNIGNSLSLTNGLSISRTGGSAHSHNINITGDITGTGNISVVTGGARGNVNLGNVNSAGTLSFDLATTQQMTSPDAVSTVNGVIGSNVTSLTKSGAVRLELGGSGANLYTGGTFVNSGLLVATKAGALGTGDVTVAETGVLQLNAAAMANDISVYLESGGTFAELILNASQTVGALYFNGVAQALGTWGASGSGATNINDDFFSGTGVLTVAAVPEPGTCALMLGGLGMLYVLRRRTARNG